MGTHPIFESDFDCLTESYVEITRKKSPGDISISGAMATLRYGLVTKTGRHTGSGIF